eukprot:g7425.t1
MACGTALDGDEDDLERGGGHAGHVGQMGHQLAKYLSCCGASQCAETHICSRRVAKVGAAACKHCGGAGGGSDWAKAFATALCEIFDCPAIVEREALDLVTSAVAFVSPPSPSGPGISGDVIGDVNGGDDGGRPRNSEGGGGRAAKEGGGGGGDCGGSGGGSGDAVVSNGEGDSYYSSGSEGGLGSSWGSVSELASACVADAAHGNVAGASKNRWRRGGLNERADEDDDDDDDDDDDEVVRKGIWFPPPSTAGARDPLLASSTAVATAGNGDARSAGSSARGTTSTAAGGEERRTPPSRPSSSAPQDDDEARRILKEREARSSPRASTLSGRLRRWHRFGVAAAAAAAAAAERPATRASPDPVDEADHGRRRRRRPSTDRGGLDAAPLPLCPRGDAGGGGEAGSEFVVLVSREATVRELATSVGEFPPEWLVGAFGLVVRRQVEAAVYDARARAAMKRAVRLLEGKVSWKQVAITEKELATLAQDQDTGRIQDGDQNKEAAVSGRYWKVGLAAAGGGVLLFLSGGVAAPSVTASLSAVGFAAANSVSYVAPSLGAWLGYTSTTSAAAAAAAATAATTGAASGAGSVGAFSAVSGAAGAGVAGYKMTRRTAGVQEFHFLPLHSHWPLDSPESMFEGASEPGLPVFICVPGWHEPGHDPRHTWGGIGYAHANAAAAAAAAAATTAANPGATPDATPPPSAPAAPPATAAATAEPTAAREDSKGRVGAPMAELGGPASDPRRVAAGAGAAVSRWFSSAAPSSPPLQSSRTLGRSQAHVGDRGQHRRDHHHQQQQQQQQQQRRDPNAFGRSGGGGGVPAPAPMASSFIDLGVDRGMRDSNGGGGGGALCGEKDKGDLRYRQRRRRNRFQENRISEGSEAVAGARVEGAEGEEEDDDDPDGENAGMEDSWEALPSHAWWRDFVSGGEEHVLVWERGPLTELHAAIRDLAWKKASRRAVNEALKRSALAPVVAAAALPLALLEAASGLDDPWGVVRSRALEAGRLLAAVLLSRPVGSRPVTLLGFSMGAKVVFNCLEALAAAPEGRGLGIVENAVMLGTPIGTKRGRWKRARSAVAGRLVNGYSSRDWLLALVYRTKSWSVGVAGTSRVEGCGVENVDLSGLVTWHLSYSRILPTVMAMLRLEE